jgi:hypothetical protein
MKCNENSKTQEKNEREKENLKKKYWNTIFRLYCHSLTDSTICRSLLRRGLPKKKKVTQRFIKQEGGGG